MINIPEPYNCLPFSYVKLIQLLTDKNRRWKHNRRLVTVFAQLYNCAWKVTHGSLLLFLQIYNNSQPAEVVLTMHNNLWEVVKKVLLFSTSERKYQILHALHHQNTLILLLYFRVMHMCLATRWTH